MNVKIGSSWKDKRKSVNYRCIVVNIYAGHFGSVVVFKYTATPKSWEHLLGAEESYYKHTFLEHYEPVYVVEGFEV